MNEPLNVAAKLFLCDWAEVVAGKLYAQGMGWTDLIADRPVQFAIACMITIPFDQTNTKHSGMIKLVTDDGHDYPAENPGTAGFDFEVGRPPGITPGRAQILPFALKIGGVSFTAGGYRVELYVDQELVDAISFEAHKTPLIAGGDKS
jgi:Family of unknown function (DUF6941)